MWILLSLRLMGGELEYHHLQAFESEEKCNSTIEEIKDNFDPREMLVCMMEQLK